MIRNILHNVPGLALQDFTEHLNCVGADTLISFDSGDLSGTDMMLLDQSVLCDTFYFHNDPEISKGNHNIQASLSA